MKITHHKNGEIKTLVDEAPYHPGYEDAGFKPKAVNNKPVAWIELELWESGKYPPDDCFSEHPFENAIPLYTNPVKELTDEEIMDEVFKAGLAVSKDTDVFLLEHDVEAFIEFAKAILRKAQEK